MHPAPTDSILVVDDCASSRLLLRNALDGFDVVGEAANTADAIAAMAADTPAGVTVDLHLGRENGLRLIERLRRHHRHLAVVLVTSAFDLHIADAARLAGADAALDKRGILTTLPTAMRTAIDERSGNASGRMPRWPSHSAPLPASTAIR